MGRTILKYIYPWSVLHTFTIRWISTLDMTLVRSYHMGKFTSSYLQFSKNLASQGLLCSTWRYWRTLLCDRATRDTCPGSQKIWPLYLQWFCTAWGWMMSSYLRSKKWISKIQNVSSVSPDLRECKQSSVKLWALFDADNNFLKF